MTTDQELFDRLNHLLPWVGGLIVTVGVGWTSWSLMRRLMNDDDEKPIAHYAVMAGMSTVVGLSLVLGSSGVTSLVVRPDTTNHSTTATTTGTEQQEQGTPAPPKAPDAAPRRADEQKNEGPSTVTILKVILLGILGIVLLIVILGLLAWLALSIRSRLRARRTKAERIENDWCQANKIFDAVDRQYSAYLLDAADQLFERPLLSVMTNPDTVAFVEAHEQAKAQREAGKPDTTTEARHRLEQMRQLRRLWDTASSKARAETHANLDPTQTRRLARIRKLLETALDPSTGAEHRENLIDTIERLMRQIRPDRDRPSAHDVIASTATRQRDNAALSSKPKTLALTAPPAQERQEQL